jgi:hypothetical protein
LGPRTALTKQPVSGRANDGGLRIGEMERDSVIGHGISEFLRESMMERGDDYQMVVCNTTGALAIYNRARDLFMSPMADGPLRFFRSETGKGYALDTMTRYGRKFSVVSVPYSLKLLIQELAAINIQLRIVTEDNLPQIDSMAFSDNMNRLTLKPDMTPETLVKEIGRAFNKSDKLIKTPNSLNQEEINEFEKMTNERKAKLREEMERNKPSLSSSQPESDQESPKYVPDSPRYNPKSPENSPPPGSPYYNPGSPEYVPTSPAYNPDAIDGRGVSGGVGESISISRGSVQSINDFELGEPVYFTRSVDLGLQQNHVWKVAKKGGTLLTLTADRGSLLGGGTNLTNSDLVQIAKSDELVKIDAFSKWEEQRAGALLAQQQQYQMQQQQYQSDMMRGGGVPTMPQINIKMVGGNDFSKTDENGPSISNPAAIDVTGGGNSDFNNLMIPSVGRQSGGGSSSKSSEASSSGKSEKTIMGGLADFGNLVINKIM